MKDTAGVASQLNTLGGENTYRFKSFKQRADEIEINVARRINRRLDDEPDDDQHGSYFAEGISKWSELNCTRDFTEFLRQVRGYHQSLAQVLYHKEDIVQAIEAYMTVDHELVTEAMLDLVTTLARDLQEEVLPYFERLVRRISPLIRTAATVETVEAACNSLAYLFKYLSKSLVVDLRPTFTLMAPMLGVERQRANVRRFTAESMAFLVRKLRGEPLQLFVEHVVHSMLECSEQTAADFQSGLALLFFECMRNVESQLHSRASAILKALLKELYKEDLDSGLGSNPVYKLVADTLKLCLHYTKRESAQTYLWSVLLAEFDVCMRDATAEGRVQPAVALVGLLASATIVRKGSRVSEYKPLFQRCQTAFDAAQKIQTTEDNEPVLRVLARERVKWLAALLIQSPAAEMASTGKVLLDLAVSTEPLDNILAMATTMARLEWPQWSQIMLPYLVRLTAKKWSLGKESRASLLLFWAEVFQRGLVGGTAGNISSVVTARGQVLFTEKTTNGASISELLVEWLAEPIDWDRAASRTQTIPSLEPDQFSGFESDDEAEEQESVVTDLATKSALITVLSHTVVDSTVLCDALDSLAASLVAAISQTTDEDGDDEDDLGLSMPKEERLYWGHYHRVYPLVTLLGRVLQLEASTAIHGRTQESVERLLVLWKSTLEHVLLRCPTNAWLLEGMSSVGDALKFAATLDGSAKEALGDLLSLEQLERIVVRLERNLASARPVLRLKTLQIMALFDQPPMLQAPCGKQQSGGGSGPEVCAMVHMAIEMESVVADMSTYKDKINHLRRMAVMATNGRVPEIYARVFPSLAVAQLSINFGYIWPEVTKQLKELASSRAGLFWDAVWGLLHRYGDERQLIEPGLAPQARKWICQEAEVRKRQQEYSQAPKLDGHAVECPNLARFERVYDAEGVRFSSLATPTFGVGTGKHLEALMALQSGSLETDHRPTDFGNIQRQLLKLLAEIGVAAAEAHSRSVVVAFLAFARSELSGWTRTFFGDREGSLSNADLAEAEYVGEYRGLLVEKSRRKSDALCVQWLALFANLRHPQQLYKSPLLHDLFLHMLTRGDPSIQKQALECLLGWKESGVRPYADNLRSLADERRFREELKTFDLAAVDGSINVVHRAQALPIVLRVLYGQMMVRNKSSRKDGMRIRRANVLGALVAVTQEELRMFVAIGLDTFRASIGRATPSERLGDESFSLTFNDSSDMDIDGSESGHGELPAGAELDRISPKALVSYFHLLTEIIRVLGVKAAPVFHESMAVILAAVSWAQHELDTANDELEQLAAEPGANSNQAVDEATEDSELEDDDDDDDDDDDEVVEASGKAGRAQLTHRKTIGREVRQLALRCLTQMFVLAPPAFDFAPYVECIYTVVIDPRLDNLPRENTQTPSALLLLLKAWVSSPRFFRFLVAFNPLTFRMLLEILVAPKVQPSVVTLVLDVLQAFLDFDPEAATSVYELNVEEAQACAQVVSTTIQGHVSQILAHMRVCFSTSMLSLSPGNSGSGRIVMRQIHLLSRIAEYATQEAQDARALLDLLLPVLKNANAVVPERVKGDVLKIAIRFIPIVLRNPTLGDVDERPRMLHHYLEAVSSGLSRIRLDTARATLTQILSLLAQIDRSLSGNEAQAEQTPLENAAWVIGELNAMSTSRIGEPDHDRRLAAFGKLNEEMWADPHQLDARAWQPVLHVLTHLAQDKDELATRSNAAFGLTRFVTRVSQACAENNEEARSGLGRIMISVLLPTIKYSLRSSPEVVQVEFVGILRHMVHECGTHFEQLRDLCCLETPDEEANFFYNILHIQTHRRTRAMRRFRDLVTRDVEKTRDSAMDVDDQEDGALKPLALAKSGESKSPITPANIRSLIFPLLETWALAEGAELNDVLANEAVQTIGQLGAVLPWSQYNTVLRRYLKMLRKPQQQKRLQRRLMRLVMALLDSFHFDLRHVSVDGRGEIVDLTAADTEELAADAETNDDVEQAESSVAVVADERDERIHSMVVGFLLPQLKRMIADTSDDEDKMELRAPVAMAIIRILAALPRQTMDVQLPGILTTICNMLRAKAQSARNATRDALIRIIKFLGPSYLGFLVKELRASLFHGAQKHVLSYTLYTLLRELIGQVEVGELDYTLEPIIEVLVNDVFGQTGADKDSEEWTTKSREARVHHGPDCFEMLASVTQFDNIRLMLAPLRDILRETDTPKRTKVVENVLRRIGIGLNRNKAYSPKTVLVFCHGIISQYLSMASTSLEDSRQQREREAALKRLRFSSKEDEATILMRRKDAAAKRDYLQANAHRFVQFGLEVVYFGLKRERFGAQEAEGLSLLDPFVNLAGDGLYSRFDSIIALCCKIWAIMVRMPLPSVRAGIPTVIKRLFTIFRQASSTNSDMIQNCFKLLASLLRSKHAESLMADYRLEELADPREKGEEPTAGDKKGKKGGKKGKKQPSTNVSMECMKNSLLSEAQLRDLIDFIRPDIEEPERQGTAFNLIRAILTRRMIVDSLYTLLDSVRSLMITAQGANVRELCRLTWFQFLMDYPLGERRLTNAMSFIVQNASSYVYESGRTSALEIMSVIVDRFADEILLPRAAEPFFLGLVLIIARDESSQCREMASHLLARLVARFDQPRLKRTWILVDQWAAGIALSAEAGSDEAKKAKQRELGRAALQCYSVVLAPLGDRFAGRIPDFFSTIDTALSISLRSWKQAEKRLNLGSGGADLEAAAAELGDAKDTGSPHSAALLYWEMAYQGLQAMSHFVEAVPNQCFGSSNNSRQPRIWQLVIKHLTHPHAWVRLAASRLVGAGMAQADPLWMLDATAKRSAWLPVENDDDVPAYSGNPKHVLVSIPCLQQLTNSLAVQLGSRYMVPELGNQVVKNLYFIARCFLAAAPEDAEDAEDDDVGSDAEDETGQKELAKERCLLWLINRVGAVARTELIRGNGATARRTYCFRWFAALISLLPATLLARTQYTVPMLSPLYRTSEAPAGNTTSRDGTEADKAEELKALAGEVMRMLQTKVGVTRFSEMLLSVQKQMSSVREERRERRKQLAIVDPQLHARKKIRKNEKEKHKRAERAREAARARVRTVVKRSYRSANGAPPATE